MATNLLPVQSLGVTASIRRTSENFRHRKTSTSVAAAASGGGNNWWSPLFGWSSDGVDYIDSSNGNNNNNGKEDQDPIRSERKPAKSKFAGCFTEEKARQLRMMTMETETFHEVMYHSAIASRLATDFPRRSSE